MHTCCYDDGTLPTYAFQSSTSGCGIPGYAFEHSICASIYVVRHINMFREAPKLFISSSSKKCFLTFSVCCLGLIVSSIHLLLREDSHRSGTSSWKPEITRRRSCKKSQQLRWALKDENNLAPHRLRRSRSVECRWRANATTSALWVLCPLEPFHAKHLKVIH